LQAFFDKVGGMVDQFSYCPFWAWRYLLTLDRIVRLRLCFDTQMKDPSKRAELDAQFEGKVLQDATCNVAFSFCSWSHEWCLDPQLTSPAP
jgi:hypothetical protein